MQLHLYLPQPKRPAPLAGPLVRALQTRQPLSAPPLLARPAVPIAPIVKAAALPEPQLAKAVPIAPQINHNVLAGAVRKIRSIAF